MKWLHTADWHLGQLFYQYDRVEEHIHFFEWLIEFSKSQKIDVLLISGDVFDHANPNIRSIQMWYRFLRDISDECPQLKIIVIAGNHDSASRLEAPQPLLDEDRIRIIGTVKRDIDGNIPMEQFCIPIYNNAQELEAYCLAIPFLRLGDFPQTAEENLSYSQGVSRMYQYANDFVQENLDAHVPRIALGHLHALSAEMAADDTFERDIMGGVDNIPVTAFSDQLQYVALGHIHKSQKIAGKDHIRYSGSPIPMSFSEIMYHHQVVTFQTIDGRVDHIEKVSIPIHTSLLKVPKKHIPLAEVLYELEQLPLLGTLDTPPAYLEVRVLLDQPEPQLKKQVEEALSNKHVKLARIDVSRVSSQQSSSTIHEVKELQDLKPIDVFNKIYFKEFNTEPSKELTQLFHEVCTEIEINSSL